MKFLYFLLPLLLLLDRVVHHHLIRCHLRCLRCGSLARCWRFPPICIVPGCSLRHPESNSPCHEECCILLRWRSSPDRSFLGHSGGSCPEVSQHKSLPALCRDVLGFRPWLSWLPLRTGIRSIGQAVVWFGFRTVCVRFWYRLLPLVMRMLL